MNRTGYFAVYLIVMVFQILLCEYLYLTQYLLLSVLPVILLCLPLEKGPGISMLIAFTSGFVIDFLTHGVLGLTSFALVPTALVRLAVISQVFGSEVLTQQESLTVNRHGITKFSTAILIVTAVFFLFYIPLDSAGTWTIGGMALRYLLSVIASTGVSLLLVNIIASE